MRRGKEAREGWKEGDEKGMRVERERCSSCTLSFKRAKNFHPWKRSLSFSLENSASTLTTQLLASHRHTEADADTAFYVPVDIIH